MRNFLMIAIAALTIGVVASVASGSILPNNDAPSPRTELPDNGRAMDPRDYQLARHGFQRGTGREVRATASGRKQFVNNSPAWRCISDADGNAVCADPRSVAEGRSFGLEMCIPDLPADQIRIRGIVPTSVDQVTVKTGTFTEVFPVAQGTTAFELQRSVVRGDISVTWSTGGAVVPLPPRLAASNCGPQAG